MKGTTMNAISLGSIATVSKTTDAKTAMKGYDIDIFTTDEAESKTFNNQSGVKVWIIQN